MSPIPMSPARSWQYLCRSKEGVLVYAFADKDDPDASSYHLFVGGDGVLRQVPLVFVQRSKSGNATYLHTRDFVFVCLALNAPYAPPTGSGWWSKLKYLLSHRSFMAKDWLYRLDPDDFDISDDLDGTVLVTRR